MSGFFCWLFQQHHMPSPHWRSTVVYKNVVCLEYSLCTFRGFFRSSSSISPSTCNFVLLLHAGPRLFPPTWLCNEELCGRNPPTSWSSSVFPSLAVFCNTSTFVIFSPGNISFTQFFVILLFLFYSPAVLFLLFLSITTFEKLCFTLAFLTYYFCLRRKIVSIPSWLSCIDARSWFQLSNIAKALLSFLLLLAASFIVIHWLR